MQYTIGTDKTEIKLEDHYSFTVSLVEPEDAEVTVNGGAVVTKNKPYSESGSSYMDSVSVQSNYADTEIEVL